MNKKSPQIGCVANRYPQSQQLMHHLIEKYHIKEIRRGYAGPLDTVIVLGGDGFMLRMLHKFAGSGVKLYGVNCGTLGFLLNPQAELCLMERINSAVVSELCPLDVTFHLNNGATSKAIAFNEAYVMRNTCQAANIRLFVDQIERISCLVADGIMLSTPSGSTAYSMSSGGMALPIDSGLHALTPICPFRPRRWPGAIIPDSSIVEFEVLSPNRRSVRGCADFIEREGVVKITMGKAHNKSALLLFDSEYSLKERIIREQFLEI